jgi:Fe-S-cluster-containing hydrogenase component 2
VDRRGVREVVGLSGTLLCTRACPFGDIFVHGGLGTVNEPDKCGTVGDARYRYSQYVFVQIRVSCFLCSGR